jgi:uncharacterized phosphosugar-binding protein
MTSLPTQPDLPPAPYLDELTAALVRARLANRRSLAAAAQIVERVVADDGIVFAFGSGHSQLATLEMNRRAGSIAGLQIVFDPTWGDAEHVEGYGATLLARTSLGPGDCLIAISHSGTTVAAIDVALAARACGAQVIAVTSIATASTARPIHSSGKNLDQLADVTLDDGAADADPADAAPDQLGAPTSTLVAAALLHEIVALAISSLAARGVEVPVIQPNSIEGGRQHNERLRDRYRGRVQLVP